MKDKLLFFGAALLGITVLLVIALNWQQPAARPAAGPQEVGNGLPAPLQRLASAQAAAQTLDAWAATWAEDAQIVTVAATLYQDSETPSPWSFQLYSKGRGKLASVVVRGQDVRLLQQQAALYPQQPLNRAEWQIDSGTVLAEWWQMHGQILWDKMKGGSLSLHLGTRSTGAPTWRVTALTSASTPLAIWEIRADTGESVSQPPSGGQK